jgi:hypothetical protein
MTWTGLTASKTCRETGSDGARCGQADGWLYVIDVSPDSLIGTVIIGLFVIDSACGPLPLSSVARCPSRVSVLLCLTQRCWSRCH